MCGSFIVFGGLSVVVYKPWRRFVERRRLGNAVEDSENNRPLEYAPEGSIDRGQSALEAHRGENSHARKVGAQRSASK